MIEDALSKKLCGEGELELTGDAEKENFGFGTVFMLSNVFFER